MKDLLKNWKKTIKNLKRKMNNEKIDSPKFQELNDFLSINDEKCAIKKERLSELLFLCGEILDNYELRNSYKEIDVLRKLTGIALDLESYLLEFSKSEIIGNYFL